VDGSPSGGGTQVSCFVGEIDDDDEDEDYDDDEDDDDDSDEDDDDEDDYAKESSGRRGKVMRKDALDAL